MVARAFPYSFVSLRCCLPSLRIKSAISAAAEGIIFHINSFDIRFILKHTKIRSNCGCKSTPLSYFILEDTMGLYSYSFLLALLSAAIGVT